MLWATVAMLLGCQMGPDLGLRPDHLPALANELDQPSGPEEIIFVSQRYQQWIVRRFDQRATLTWIERDRTHHADLSAQQWGAFEALLTKNDGTTLQQSFGECASICGEYLHIGSIVPERTESAQWTPCEWSRKFQGFMGRLMDLIPEDMTTTYPRLEEMRGFRLLATTNEDIHTVCGDSQGPFYMNWDDRWIDLDEKLVSPERISPSCFQDEHIEPFKRARRSEWTHRTRCPETPEESCQLTRRNQHTGEEFPIELPVNRGFKVATRYPVLNRIAVILSDGEASGSKAYVVDLGSGAVAPAHTDVLTTLDLLKEVERAFRRPQPSRISGTAVIVPAYPDPEAGRSGPSIVRIELQDFSYEVLAVYPELRIGMVESEYVWVDEIRNVAYIAYFQCDLLELPLNRVSKASP